MADELTRTEPRCSVRLSVQRGWSQALWYVVLSAMNALSVSHCICGPYTVNPFTVDQAVCIVMDELTTPLHYHCWAEAILHLFNLTFRWPCIVINSYNKTNQMHWFLKFIFGINSTCFAQFFCPSSGVQHCTHSNGVCHTCLLRACEQDQSWSCSQAVSKTCMTYIIAVCTVKNSLWWTEELSEICRVLFQI